MCTNRAASHVLSLSPHERSSLLHVLSLSLLDVQLSSLRAEEFTDYRLSGRNRPGFKSTADPDYRDVCNESPIGTFRKCPARWCLGSSKWAFNGGHRYIRTRRTAAHPPAHTQTALMLALHWPSEPRPLDPLPFGHWSRRTPVTIGIGRYRLSSLLARDGARNHSINRTLDETAGS